MHRAHLAAQAREHVLYALRLLAGGDLAVHAAVLGAPGRAVAAGQLPEVDEVALVGRYGHRKSLVLSHAAQARDEFLHAGPAGGVGEGEDEEEAVRPQDGGPRVTPGPGSGDTVRVIVRTINRRG